MKPKMTLKIGIDLAMTMLLLCQMAYMLIGEIEHEWTGTVMFVLFILHHALNWRWYANLAKGRYTIARIFQVFVDFLILFCMLSLMVSGIIMSREVFSWLPINGSMAFARILHMLASYWGFTFMSIHLGLHWGMVMGILRRFRGITRNSQRRVWTLRLCAVLICICGIYSFVKNNIADYLFLKNQFVFFDLEQPLVLFFAEYVAMMGLWICLGYYAFQGAQRLEKLIQKKKMKTNSN